MRFCKRPFENIEIEPNYNVFTCCSRYVNYLSIGNVMKDSFDEIWNSQTVQDFRQRILNGDYSLCNLQSCCVYTSLQDIPVSEITEKYSPVMKEYPKYVSFDHDRICNAKCGMCRDTIVDNDEENIRKLNKIADEQLIPLCQSAEKVYMSGSGELFYSKHSRYLVKRLCELYPDIRFDIISNGFLCNEQNIRDLGLTDKIDNLTISIHAASKNTHKKIMQAGSYDVILKNLKSVKKLLDENKIKKVILVFIVSSINYKEMPAFAEMAKKLGMTATFCEYTKRDNTSMGEKADEYSVHLKSHPKHKDFLKILKKDIFAPSEVCFLNPLITQLREEALNS